MERESASLPIFWDQEGIAHIHPELEPMTPQREKSLVRQSIAKDADAFGELFNHHKPIVHRYIYSMVGNNEDAEDLVSSTFESAFKAIPKYQITEAPFSSWIIRIAHNRAISHLRSKKESSEVHKDISASHPRFDSHTRAELSEDMERVKESLLQLKEKEQKAILMKHVMGMSYKEVAGELGINVKSARVVVFRGLKKLRRNLGNLNTIDLHGEGVA